MTRCDKCKKRVAVGDWPYCPHGKPSPSKGFEPYENVSLGQVVTGVGDINKACRPQWENDHIVQLQPRDKPPIYWKELNDRREARKYDR